MSRPRREIVADVEDSYVDEPVETLVVDDIVSARIKGTWTMHWGHTSYNFEDGKRYRIPRDLFHYLKARSCIYDTL